MPRSLIPSSPVSTPRRRVLRAGWTTAAALALTACGAPSLTQQQPPAAAVARAYRSTAARHLYAHNAARIYSGMLPPMLYAVGVLQVDLAESGAVRRLHWLRAPRHAPEVIAEIERTVRAAAPYPSVPRGGITYTDTWLWDRSGQFQLDTLTEGQLRE